MCAVGVLVMSRRPNRGGGADARARRQAEKDKDRPARGEAT